ncbi:molybdopterin-dependent oxidoreductase [Deinococcus sp. QL22]|uniref:molybdopterin-dependent oxidoreductase n=1 Tax=Deinococcus sp. QL22 TaxID=2939437 RepID=UPI0020182F1A|nr:molybdopterin-dependent oxidoreductase [Deinococcus sp. QL22]UQN06816.1 molybdopterin-dependent oxidoreductase [Deinococcus sp. QL22]
MKYLRAFIAVALLSVLGFIGLEVLGWVNPVVALFGRITQALGVPAVFQFLHQIFGLGSTGKSVAFAGVLVGWLGGLTLLGGLLRPWQAGAVVALALLAFTPLEVALGNGAVFGLLLWALEKLLSLRAAPASVPPTTADLVPPPYLPNLRLNQADATRRTVTLALAGTGAAVLAAGAGRLISMSGGGASASAAATPVMPGSLPAGVTPVSNWYYVSKNLEALDPRIKAEKWRLTVDGLVGTPKTLTLEDLGRFPAVTSERTLACISNPVGGPLISNGIWEGFRLSDLLREVGIGKGARHVLWEAEDGYTESLPLGDALDPEVLLVTRLNGAALTPKHGFPLRVLIPDRYGMKQPRWLTKITLSATDKPGYWVQRDWSRTARLELQSRIDFPEEINPQVKAGQPITVRGMAFFGSKPITRVEVSTDGGQTWGQAKLTPPRNTSVWTLWAYDWTPIAGAAMLMARAYSGSVVQKTAERDALPEGATGYHRFIVNAG